MIVGDVGQGAREEIDFAPSPGGGIVSGGGANYGWNCREGSIAYPPPACSPIGTVVDPVFEYPHDDPGGGAAYGCSVIGGYVARDRDLGDLFGRYVYTDFCTGEIRSLVLPDTAGGLASGDRSEGLFVANPISFGEDSCGRLYVISNGGGVYRFEGSPAGCPAAAPASAASAPVRKARRARLRLHAKGAGPRVRLVARLAPCAGRGGAGVQLNRGGRRFAVKRLNGRCVARFTARVLRRSTFRALLRDPAVRSRRLAVKPELAGRPGSRSGPSARSHR